MSIESITTDEPGTSPKYATIELEAYGDNNRKTMLQLYLGYTHKCGIDPFSNVTSLAWLQFENQEPASDELCNPCKSKNTKSDKSAKGPKSYKSGKGKGSKSGKGKGGKSDECQKKVVKAHKSKSGKGKGGTGKGGKYKGTKSLKHSKSGKGKGKGAYTYSWGGNQYDETKKNMDYSH